MYLEEVSSVLAKLNLEAAGSSECWQCSTRLHSIKFNKTAKLKVTVVRSSDLAETNSPGTLDLCSGRSVT
jgi:hypothetical protein